MITGLQFKNFRALEKYRLTLDSFNVLVGPNNAGKSTILDGLRLLAGAYRFAASRNPEILQLEDGAIVNGWALPPGSLAIDVENIHTDYRDEATQVVFRLERGRKLVLTFPVAGRPILHMETGGPTPKSTKKFREEFAASVAIVPTLGPLERSEALSKPEYVRQAARGHRAARLFRNLWFHDGDQFDRFKQLLESTWDGVTIGRPELHVGDGGLVMFIEENRIAREVAWAGFGFQIWLQLLTHIVRGREGTMLVVDEPEIYLHPDLQRKIVSLLREAGPQIVLATHSVEVINEVEPQEVLLIERGRAEAPRLADLPGLDRAISLLGSSQNIYLARLAREKRILFVEGLDRRLLQRLASKVGLPLLFDAGRLAVVPIRGFSGHAKIQHAQWAFSEVLGEGMSVGALFDRDYRCNEELDELEKRLKECTDIVHVLSRKEIENYLLVPSVVQRAIEARLQQRSSRGQLAVLPEFSAEALLLDVSDGFRSEVKSQLGARRIEFLRSSGQDAAVILRDVEDAIDREWRNWDDRVKRVPGKDVLSALNRRIGELWGVSITAAQLASGMRISEVPVELVDLFRRIDAEMLSGSSEPA